MHNHPFSPRIQVHQKKIGSLVKALIILLLIECRLMVVATISPVFIHPVRKRRMSIGQQTTSYESMLSDLDFFHFFENFLKTTNLGWLTWCNPGVWEWLKSVLVYGNVPSNLPFRCLDVDRNMSSKQLQMKACCCQSPIILFGGFLKSFGKNATVFFYSFYPSTKKLKYKKEEKQLRIEASFETISRHIPDMDLQGIFRHGKGKQFTTFILKNNISKLF